MPPHSTPRKPAPLPLGAMAAGLGLSLLSSPLLAQADASNAPIPPTAAPAQTLPAVSVKAKRAQTPDAKQGYQAVTTGVGKGQQAIRDIPQSLTVITEKLMDDRNLDDFKELLRTTAGVTFQAGETGEEDVRLRGFSLSQAGDIYIDGMKDASLYERDTFNNDRVEVLKGSASMLFGRGSTGGIVNQVGKQPFLMTQHEVTLTLGTGQERRATGDFNIKTGESSALRINAMVQDQDNNGARIDKRGIAPTYRWGIGTADEFSVGLYALDYDNRPIYNHPWFLSHGTQGTLLPKLKATAYYGLESDYNQGSARYATVNHLHRFADGGELKTALRHGLYQRSLWATVVRYGQTNGVATTLDNLSDDTILTRASKGRVAITESTALQSDYSNKFKLGEQMHQVITGLDFTRDDARRANNYPDAQGTTRPSTTVGTPDDGAWIADTRPDAVFNTFTAQNVGLYAQDMIELTPTVKLIGGVRHDQFQASYRTAAGGTFSRSESLWSRRFGALYQPNEWASYHVSYGTSFNTSGDAYQFAVQGPSQRVANTPPEMSRNIEIGGKFDLFEQRLSLGASLFHTEKYNERNTDPDSAATQELLSGKRHAAGLDLDVAGRITPQWDAFVSYTWIPDARIDKSNVVLAANGRGAQVQGDRPGLTPRQSGSVWTTYRLNPQWRVGAGLNYRGKQNPEGARHVMADSFTTLDLMAQYTIREGLSMKVNVTNVTDKLYADALYRGFYAPGAPRAVQWTLQSTF